jgi:23S rRNA (adenine2503-C2)-methyltransferase
MERVRAFHEVLKRQRISTTVRLRRGIDIQAGCGQLRSRVKLDV